MKVLASCLSHGDLYTEVFIVVYLNGLVYGSITGCLMGTGLRVFTSCLWWGLVYWSFHWLSV